MVNEIKYLFPDAVIGVDVIFRDDGSGVYIDEWNLQVPQPTQAEIDAVTVVANELATYNLKWEQIDAQAKALTVTIPTSNHKYAANPEAIKALSLTHSGLADGASVNWREPWGTWVADKLELQEAHMLAQQAYQTLQDTIFGV